MPKEKACDDCKVDRVEKTSEKLTDRGGLTPFVHFLRSREVADWLARQWSDLRQSKKGLPLSQVFKQILCFFMDGTNLSISHFDELADDPGYGRAIETAQEKMLSSDQVKRLFGKFQVSLFPRFRSLLRQLFRWRLLQKEPDVVVLNVDPMVMNNDGARRREGVQPTYKKVKGFQPLQVSWGPYVVDAVFRGGSKNGNHGNTVLNTIRRLVKVVRDCLGEEVPIIVLMDAGFEDQRIYRCLEDMDIGYIGTGKMYDDIRETASLISEKLWDPYSNGTVKWRLTSFGSRRGTWSRFRRTVFLRRQNEEDGQGVLPPMRPETVMYTNLGMGGRIDELLSEAGYEHWLFRRQIVRLSHGRGADELTWRVEKDFGTEKLPFQRFYSNAAYYYLMLIAQNIYEAFKRDACRGIVDEEVYPTTFRRVVIDVAAKIVRSGGQITMKYAAAVWRRLQIPRLWERVNAPPDVALA